MTPDEIEKLAREAGVLSLLSRPLASRAEWDKAIARLVELSERAAMEKAAMVCDQYAAGDFCAAAIRSAAQKEA